MTETDVASTVLEMRRWLLDEGRFLKGTGTFDEAFVAKLRALGFPIKRFTTGIPSLHPQVDSFSTLWEEGKGLSFREFKRSVTDSRDTDRGPGKTVFREEKGSAGGLLEGSPIEAVYESGRTVRHRLEDGPRVNEYSLLTEMRADGYTDYVAIPILFADRSVKVATFATSRPGGFSGGEVAALEDICSDFGLIIETRYLRHLASTLVNTYVGPVAGQRVLDGEIKRGMGETIRAAIWFCDLKGFTTLSELLPEAQTLDLLNDYFDVVTKAIEDQRGEVLKFIGDAVLAIFTPADDGDEAEAVTRALAAARQCSVNITERNRDRKAARKQAIGLGVALHFGDVHYGNVGGVTRLDFTVIGSAVNLASRIEGLTRELERPILVSSEFAALHPDSFEALGEFAFKGISEKRSVYAPA